MYGVFLDRRGERLYREYDVDDERRAADVGRKLHEPPIVDEAATVLAVVKRNGAPTPRRWTVVGYCRTCGLCVWEDEGFRLDEHDHMHHRDC